MVKTKKQDKYLYPVTPETIHQYAASIFSPIKRGECVTAIWVSMAGRRMWNKFVIENIKLFEKELPNHQKYLLVYIEPLDLTEETLVGYLRLMGEAFVEVCRARKVCDEVIDLKPEAKVFAKESSSYPKLLKALKSLLKKVTDSDFEVVFFLGEFDELRRFAKNVFYNNLKSLWDTFRPKSHYVFLTVEDLTTAQATDKLGELNAASLQNVIYVPIRQERDIDYLIDFFSERLRCQFGKKERGLIKEVCGGHPYLIKAASRIICDLVGEKSKVESLESILMNHYEMLAVTRRIFNLRTKREKEILNKVAAGKEVDSSVDLRRLIKLGLIEEKKNRRYELVGKLLKQVAEDYRKTIKLEDGKEKDGLYLNEGGGVVCYAGVPVEEKFTAQEYNVIKFFLEHPGKLKTREEVSEAMWGEESYEKYSDWAIDQLMSKLRKKLKKLGAKTKLATIRGRGYKLV